MYLKDGIRGGLITFGIILFLNLLGLPLTAGSSIIPIFTVLVGLLALLLLRSRVGQERSQLSASDNGLLIGLISGIV